MKILVFRNNVPYPIDGFDKATSFFKSRLPFPIEFTYKDINIPTPVTVYKTVKGFNAQTGKPSDIKYMGLTESVENHLKTLVKDNEYFAVMFAWDLDTAPQSGDSVVTSWCMANGLHPNTEYIQLAINKYLNVNGSNWKRITHEIMHALFFALKRKGVNISDPMDSWKTPNDFVENDNPESLTGNYAEAFKRLQPHLNKLMETKKMEILQQQRSSRIKR